MSKNLIRSYCLLLIVNLLSACGDTSNSRIETVFPEEKASVDDCGSEVLSTRFLVHWKNGQITLETAANRNDLIEKVIDPQLDKIAFVEADRLIQYRAPSSIEDSVVTLGKEDPLHLWGPINARASELWRKGHWGAGAIVAVIDTGVDYTHPLLRDQIAINSGEEGRDANGADKRFNGIDDDNNGYIDDWLGYHFYDPDNSDPFDLDFHGTHVAGIVAGSHPDNECDHPLLPNGNDCDSNAGTINSTRKPVTDAPLGLAPRSKIVISGFLSRNGGALSDAIKAIDYAVARGAHIINASWGGAAQCSLALYKAIEALEQKEVLFVAAAGNSGLNIDERPEYPAAHRLNSQITVGSISINDLPARHSNFGLKYVDLFAPGEFIFSTIPDREVGPLSGTSMATPFVAGALALLKGASPEATAQQLKRAILNSVKTNNMYRNATRGRLDVASALEALREELNRSKQNLTPEALGYRK